MRKDEKRVVYVPRIISRGDITDKDEWFSRNYDNYTKVMRSSQNTLKDHVIVPVERNVLKGLFEGYVDKNTGEPLEGLEETITRVLELEEGRYDMKATINPTARPSYKEILSEFTMFLKHAKEDNANGRWREGIRRHAKEPYIELEYAESTLERIHNERLNLGIKSTVYPISKQTGKGLDYDEFARQFAKLSDENGTPASITILLPYSDNPIINEESVMKYIRANVMLLMMDGFKGEFKSQLIRSDGIRLNYLSSKRRIPHVYKAKGAGEESIVRVLYFSETRFDYNAAYHAIAGARTKSITQTNGDIAVMQRLKERNLDDIMDFENPRKRSMIRVKSEPGDDNRTSKITLIRPEKDGLPRSYTGFYDMYGRLFIRINDITNAIESLRKSTQKKRINVKLDFFPELDEQLFYNPSDAF